MLEAQEHVALTIGDFTLSGVTLSADTSDVRRAWGTPDSVVVEALPSYEPGERSTAWFYYDRAIGFDADGRRKWITISRAGRPTARGVELYAPASLLFAQYGAFHSVGPDEFVYSLGSHRITFAVQADQVLEIRLE